LKTYQGGAKKKFLSGGDKCTFGGTKYTKHAKYNKLNNTLNTSGSKISAKGSSPPQPPPPLDLSCGLYGYVILTFR